VACGCDRRSNDLNHLNDTSSVLSCRCLVDICEYMYSAVLFLLSSLIFLSYIWPFILLKNLKLLYILL
jgi:hypothetical protein